MNWKQHTPIRELARACQLGPGIEVPGALRGQLGSNARQAASASADFKRRFDAFFSAARMLVLSPVFLLVAMAARFFIAKPESGSMESRFVFGNSAPWCPTPNGAGHRSLAAAIPGSRAWGESCAAPSWTNCLSSGTSSAEK